MATDKSKHLEYVIRTHQINKEQQLLTKHKTKRDEIKEALEKEYGSKLYAIFNSGSYAKNTAVNTKFDFDMIAPFKRDSFDTLEQMYTAVYNFLSEKFQHEANVRPQKVSVGLEFYTDDDGDVVKVDVVPGRELNSGQYVDDDKLNLYIYEQWGRFEKGSEYIRTNIKAQIENIQGQIEKDSIRKVIRLLKVWKINNQKKTKSFFLELITIKAFENNEFTGNLWEKLKGVLEFIRDEVQNVSLPDPGNSNNNVADTLTDFEKTALSNDMKFMLERIEDNSDNIKTYFRINEKFEEKEDDSNQVRYGQSGNGPSVPPPTRFG